MFINYSTYLLSILFFLGSGLSAQGDCPSYLDAKYNPVLLVEMQSILEASQVMNCYPGKDDESAYERNFLLGLSYVYSNIDSAKYFHSELLNVCTRNNIKGDKLALALFLNGKIALLQDRLKLAEEYLKQAYFNSDTYELSAACEVHHDAVVGFNPVLENRKEYPDNYERSRIPIDNYYTLYIGAGIQSSNKTKLLEEAFENIGRIKNNYLKCRILSEYSKIFLLENNRIENEKFFSLLEETHERYGYLNPELNVRIRLTKVKVENVLGNNYMSNELAKELVDFYRIDTTNILEIIPGGHKGLRNESLLRYAKSLLFLTREGEGLLPVKQAYGIYSYYLKAMYVNDGYRVNYNSSRKHLAEYYTYDNILVIANYLTEKTGDLSYLKKAYSALDAVRSGQVRKEIKANQQIKEGGSLSNLLMENRAIEREIFLLREQTRKDPNRADFQLLTKKFDTYYAVGEEIQLSIKDNKRFADEVDITTTIDDIQEQLLGDSTSILLFSSGAHQHCLFINQDTVINLNLQHKLPDLTPYQHYGELISNQAPLDELNTAGYEIYQALLGDFEPYLTKNIAIVSNGIFETFPFSALPIDDTERPKYMLDEHVFSYHYSLRTFQHDREAENKSDQNGLLAMAPKFSSTIQYASGRTTDGTEDLYLRPLRYNISEVESLKEKIYGLTYTGEEASKDNFIAEARNHRILHLASHAIANISEGDQSTLFLNQSSNKSANKNSQSLKAGEISALVLDADLVVLSACETGLGTQLLSEGTVGLTRAFTNAGAYSLLSTLWSVDDRATSEIINNFYDQLLKGNTKSTALSTAQREFRTKYAGSEKDHPYFWAPFVFVGNDFPLEHLNGTPTNWIVPVLLVGLIAAAGLWLLSRQKTMTI